MLFNFYAETAFTEICKCGHFGIHLRSHKYRLQQSNDRHP